MTPDDPRHGSEAGHEQHIRDGEKPCPECVHGDLLASRRRSKRKAMGIPYTLPVGHLAEKVDDMRRRGITLDEIAEAAGISRQQVWHISHSGPEHIVYTRTWHRLDRMTADNIVTVIGVERRLQALVRLGYSYPRIAAEVGCHRDTISDAARGQTNYLNRAIRARIGEVYDRLSMRVAAGRNGHERASVSRARNLARKNGWAPPLAWDDDQIDDPAARPHGAAEFETPHTYQPDVDSYGCPWCGIRRQVRYEDRGKPCRDCKNVEKVA